MANETREVRFINPFRETVEKYRNSWWRGAVPLPYKRKNPPPTGYTGHRAKYPTDEEIKEWCEDGKRHNIGIRLAGVDKDHEIVGIDVDHYISGDKDKRGGDQLKDLESRLGPLPATWISSARTDGKSGIRYYRVPRGLAFRGQVDKDIECISKGYRFAVVWPSIHPDGGVYWWFPPGVSPDSNGRSQWHDSKDGVLPVAKDLPLLPEKWLAHLTQDKMRSEDDVRIDMDTSVDEIYQWAYDTFHGAEDETYCSWYADKIEKAKKKISDEATSHDKIVNAHMNLVHGAVEGHTGLVAALTEIESFWAQDVINRDKRDADEIRGEVWRSRTNALRKAKATCDERIKIGAEPIDMCCNQSGQCASTRLDAADGGGTDTGDPIDSIPGGTIKPVDDYEMNDDGNAAHLRDTFSRVGEDPSFRWVDGYGWIIWHEGEHARWERDIYGDQIMRRMWHRVKSRQITYVELLKNDYESQLQRWNNNGPMPGTVKAAREKYLKWKKFVEDNGNNRRAKNALEAAKSLVGVALDVNMLDNNPLLLGVSNGVIELNIDDVNLRRPKKQDYVTLNTNIPWEKPTEFAQHKWNEYLETFLPDEEDRRATQIALGHCLAGGNPEKIMIVLKGQPNTGKSMMVNAVELALGDYASTVSQTLFQNHKFNEDLADAIKRRMIVCSEFDEGDKLSASMVKRLTGNTDTVTSSVKYSMAKISGVPQCVPLLACNGVPKIAGSDKALENRLLVIPFNVVPRTIDKGIARRLLSVCGVACLNWLVEGLIEYNRIGHLPRPKSFQEATSKFVSELDEVSTFAYECLQQHSHMDSSSVRWQDHLDWTISVAALHQRFMSWWDENVMDYRDKPGKLKFGNRLEALGYKRGVIRTGQGTDRVWFGVKLKKPSRTVIQANFDPTTAVNKAVTSSTRNNNPNS